MNLQRVIRPCLFSRITLQSKGFACKRLAQNNQYTTQKRLFQTQTRIFHKHSSSAALVSLGLIFLGIGFYHHLSDIQKYPPSIRRSLRKALYYQQDKDLNLAIKYFNEALAEALQSSEMEKNGAPLTGIMIQLGTLQERMGRLPDARRTLTLALRHLLGLENEGVKTSSDEAIFQTELSALPALEQKKAVGIAQKLGDITATLKMDKDAEKWYEWSVEHLLSVSSKPVSEYGDTDHAIFDEEHMPRWLTKTDVGAALEAFGAFYASRNKPK
ncbi:hypothetical protein G6F56_005772 [Rhizopus delemar]|nr:hypothetical protein G6F56_005772 [Rhizopus delemar]